MNAPLIYIFIIISTFVFALFINSLCLNKKNDKVLKIVYFITFLFLLFFLSFNDSSSDFYAYTEIFEKSTFDRRYLPNQEFGFVILCSIVKLFIKNPVVAINFLRGLTLGIFCFSIFSLREKINLGFSLVAFVLLSYFPIYTMLAYMLSSALVFLGWTFFAKRKIICFVASMLLAITIHYTAFLMAVPILILLLAFKNDKPRKVFICIIIVLCFISLFFINELLVLVLKYFPVFLKYSGYFTKGNSNSGLMQLFNYLPLILCLLFLKKKFDLRYYKLAIALTISGLLFGQISYSFINLQRVYTFFLFAYIIPLSNMLKNTKRNNWCYYKLTGSKLLQCAVLLLFLVVRCYINFSTYWVSSGFDNYHFVF